MDILWLATAGFVLAIAFFNRELLIERGSLKVILSISLVLFVLAVVLTILNLNKPTLFPSLINPLVSLGLFLLMRELFGRWKKREPRDSFLDWSQGLGADRWFNIAYFTLGTFLMFLLYMCANLTDYEWH